MKNKLNKIIILLQNIKNYKKVILKNKEIICRICFEKNNKDIMINPCKCKGSIKWVHHNCLLKWITISKKYCQSCKYYYDINIQSNNFLRKHITKIAILCYSLFSYLSLIIYNLIYKQKISVKLTYYSVYHSLKIQIVFFTFL